MGFLPHSYMILYNFDATTGFFLDFKFSNEIDLKLNLE